MLLETALRFSSNVLEDIDFLWQWPVYRYMRAGSLTSDNEIV